jgi:hypothetical protein
MNTATLNKDQEQILDELERYYKDKLADEAAKRAGHGKPTGKKEIVTAEPVRVVIDPERKQVVLSWE